MKHRLSGYPWQVKEGETRIVGQNLGTEVRRKRTKFRVSGSCEWQILSNVKALLSGVELAARQLSKLNQMPCYSSAK
jgi:hypothetical protein